MLLTTIFVTLALAQDPFNPTRDQGYRYDPKSKNCTLNGRPGPGNDHYLGECATIEGTASFLEAASAVQKNGQRVIFPDDAIFEILSDTVFEHTANSLKAPYDKLDMPGKVGKFDQWLSEYAKRKQKERKDVLNLFVSKLNLSNFDLRGSTFRNVEMPKADLTMAKLDGAKLVLVNLEGANLSGASLKNIKIAGVNFRGANLRGADLEGLAFGTAKLNGRDVGESSFEGATFDAQTKLPFSEDVAISKFKMVRATAAEGSSAPAAQVGR